MLLARELCNCDHVTVFLTSEGSAPQVLLAANNGPSQVAHDVAKKYVAHYWHLDPVRRVGNQRKSIALVQVENLEIDHSDYRRDCYKSVGLDRRLSNILDLLAGSLGKPVHKVVNQKRYIFSARA